MITKSVLIVLQPAYTSKVSNGWN